MSAKACVDLVAVVDDRSPTGRSCGSCGRYVVDYGGKLEHRRGGSQLSRGGAAPDRPQRLSRAEVVSQLPDRVGALEERLASIEAGQQALADLANELCAEIREWTARQPIYVEMRPRHQRVADGGEGGTRERKALKRIPA